MYVLAFDADRQPLSPRERSPETLSRGDVITSPRDVGRRSYALRTSGASAMTHQYLFQFFITNLFSLVFTHSIALVVRISCLSSVGLSLSVFVMTTSRHYT